jgi:preprotein translocase subunit SecD
VRRLTVVPAAVYAERPMRRLLRILLLLILVSLAAIGATFMAGERAFRQQSPAVRLVYEVQPHGSDPARLAELAKALKQRINRQEMRDVQVRPAGARIEVLSPASVPKADLKRVLRIGGMLSFHVVVEDSAEPGVAEMIARLQEGGVGPQPQIGDRLRWLPAAQDGISPLESSSGGASYILVHATPQHAMTHDDPKRPWKVERAQPIADKASGGTAVTFDLDRNGAKLFGELTGAHIGKMLAIVLDGRVLSAPRINTRIEGHGIINGPPGGFTQQQASYLATTLNAGALPAKLADEPVSEEYVAMQVGLTPFTRETLKSAAIALGVAAAVLWCALRLHRRLHPTIRDQEASLRSIGMYGES